MDTETIARAAICTRPDLSLLRVVGKDALEFLHAQTTQSLSGLSSGTTRLAAWLNPKGRTLALFDVVTTDSACWLVLPADNADFVAAGLRRYILRADVAIEAVTTHRVATACGDVDDWLGASGLEPGTASVTASGESWLARTSVSAATLIVGPGDTAAAAARSDTESLEAAWQAEIAAGRPEVNAAMRERYLPQMLNLDRLDAVAFSKGCYPGQEIVARTTNLGEVKRRLQRFAITAGARPAPGAEVVAADGAPAGEINRVAATSDGFEALAVAKLDASAPLQLTDGRVLTPQALPYDL